MKRLNRVRPGEPISAQHYNAMVDAINTLIAPSSAGGIKVSHGPLGLKIQGSAGGAKLKLIILDSEMTYDKTTPEANGVAASVWASFPEEDSGANITVEPWMLQHEESVPAGTEGVAAFINGRWYLIDWACKVSDRTEAAEGMAGGGETAQTSPTGGETATTASATDTATNSPTLSTGGDGGYSNPLAR